MTTNLPANLNDVSDEELNAALGISHDNGFDNVTRLKINKDAEDDQEKALPMGTFFIVKKDTPRVYAKEITMRIVTRVFQYQHFDQTVKKMLDQSVLNSDLFGEFPSSSGKVKCGKLSKKQLEGVNVSEAQAKVQKDVKCRMFIFGLVSYKGNTQDGTEVSYVDEPVLWVPGQSGWKIMNDVLESFEKQKRAGIKYPVTIKLKKEKNGAVTYYVPVPSIGSEPVKLTQVDSIAISSAMEYVKSVNNKIMTDYRRAHSKAPHENDNTDSENVKEMGGQVRRKSDPDLDDEIPF